MRKHECVILILLWAFMLGLMLSIIVETYS